MRGLLRSVDRWMEIHWNDIMWVAFIVLVVGVIVCEGIKVVNFNRWGWR
jgi:hypothetical protein